ncbi:YdcF family protein [Erwinia sp. AnSW2-5]|uniref:YdcF family protein n=1 Tax=Erwinia sp. AnSW2-5 TaxID=3367692 RepID=UPI00385A3075
MILTPQNIDHLNTISPWLAVNDVHGEQALHADVAILAGHAVLPGLLGAFSRLAATDIPLLLSGGIGHSTELLKSALHTVQVNSDASSEAQLLADAAVQLCGIRADQLIIEDQSRNCGENAAFSRRALLTRELAAQRIIVIQDPLMQRRTTETFRHEWQRQGQQADFISWPVFVPQLVLQDGQPLIAGAASQQGLWAMDRYVSMVLGEVRRLRDDKEGYGPLGLGFIGHVDVPHAVEHAWQRLMAEPELAALVR